MKELVFLLEEKSARVMLEATLPRLAAGADGFDPFQQVKYITFEGKRDMRRKLWRRLHLYYNPKAVFVVLQDQDGGDCKAIKKELQELIPQNKKQKTLVRIACHKLENFYLGDLLAVEKGMNIGKIAKMQDKAKYRAPDKILNAKEELQSITKKQYWAGPGSRSIAPFLNLEGRNKSASFNALIKGIKKLIS